MSQAALQTTPDDRQAPAAGDREKLLIAQARAVVADLFERRPGLYWLDFGLSAAAAWGFTAVYFVGPGGAPVQVLALFLAAVAFFRAGTFMHEIIHFRRDEMRAFRWVWNLVVGFPLLTPWILYRNHIEHHTRAHFGTPRDGEYLPLAACPPAETLKYLVQILVLPPLAVLRFGVLGPASHLHGGLREWLLTRASAAVTNPYYRKRFPARHEPELVRSEWFCFGWLALLAGLTLLGPVQGVHWLMAWALLSTALGLNWLRNLAAHRYSNPGGTMSHLDQVQDAYNLTGQTWLALWFFPVGLRFHALHHLFPGLPYHSLPEAHRRLMRALPADHPYRNANEDSYFRIVGRLLSGARDHRNRVDVVRRWQIRG